MESKHACKLCMETFSDDARPRCLNCGHSFCTICVDKLLNEGKLVCPKCKAVSCANSSSEFPINFDLEESILSSKMSVVTIDTESIGSCKSIQMKTIIDEQRNGIFKLISKSKDLYSELKEYEVFIFGKKVKYEDLAQKIRELVIQNNDVLHHLEEDQKRMVELLMEVEEKSTEVQEVLPLLHTGQGTAAFVSAFAGIDEKVKSLEECNDMCQQVFPNLRNLTLEKTLLGSLNTLNLLDKIDWISGNNTLSVEVLKNMSDAMKAVLDEGRVYAIHTHNKKDMYARLSLDKDEVFLHHLKTVQPPSHVLTIKQSDLLELLDDDSVEVFMDLSWDGTAKGKVHIDLNPYTPLGNQFRALCTGEHGVSYAKSIFLRVNNKGGHNESISGGDYELNNGNGGAAVIQDLHPDDALYTKMLYAGGVFSTQGVAKQTTNTQFSIVTSEVNTVSNNGVFGKVIEGLNLLKLATNTTVTNVKIGDCGVKLPVKKTF